jgi:hypothetical protein
MLKFFPAVAAMVVALAAPSAANTFALGPSRVDSFPMSIRPDTSVPPIQLGAILVTQLVYTASGKAVADVPCVNCVLPPGGGYVKPPAGTFGLGEPLAIVSSKVPAAYVVTTYSNASYNGDCNFNIVIVAAGKTIVNSTQKLPAFKAGYYGSIKEPYMRGEIPFAGQVTITTQLKCGTYTTPKATTTVFVD